jgi:protein-tyrosine phosphatase
LFSWIAVEMLPDIYWVKEANPGRLGVMARPRGGEWLAAEVDGWQRLSVATVVSLLERSEAIDLQLVDEGSACKDRAISFISHPIADRGVPPVLAKFGALVKDIANQIRNGKTIVVHCRAGIGRSGLFAAAVLAELGYPTKDCFAAISRARRVPVPDTSEQEEWFFAERWRRQEPTLR